MQRANAFAIHLVEKLVFGECAHWTIYISNLVERRHVWEIRNLWGFEQPQTAVGSIKSLPNECIYQRHKFPKNQDGEHQPVPKFIYNVHNENNTNYKQWIWCENNWLSTNSRSLQIPYGTRKNVCFQRITQQTAWYPWSRCFVVWVNKHTTIVYTIALFEAWENEKGCALTKRFRW